MRGFDGLVVTEATTLHDVDLKAANTRDAQNRIKPATLPGVSAEGGTIVASPPPPHGRSSVWSPPTPKTRDHNKVQTWFLSCHTFHVPHNILDNLAKRRTLDQDAK
jgi:hypothetical protein